MGRRGWVVGDLVGVVKGCSEAWYESRYLIETRSSINVFSLYQPGNCFSV